MVDEQRVGWRPRLVQWLADFLGVETYPVPWAILIYATQPENDLAAQHRARRNDDEAVH